MFTIRPFEKTDLEIDAIVTVENAVWPDYPNTIEEWTHRDNTRDPKYLFERVVVEADGRIVAYGMYCEPWWSMKPGKYYIDVGVHPDHRRHGIGTAVYSHVMKVLAEREPVTITASTREDYTDGVRFLTQRDFKQVMREPSSHLDIVNFDHAEFPEFPAKMEELGIKILPLTELQASEPDWQRTLWDLEWELLQDVPSPDPLTRQSFENFVERTLGSPSFMPDAWFMAMDGDQWVGMSCLWKASAEPEKLYTGLTGVVRSHRRKGIATAMKLRAIEFAQRYGATIIETDNEEGNPMYSLNLRLGFKPQPAWLMFEKKMDAN